MEITACLNLGGTAGLMIAPTTAADSEVVGIVGVDAYGNGAMVSPATKAQLGFGFEAGAEMGIGATACLGGINVRQTEVERAAADLRDAVNSLAQNLVLKAASNLKSAIDELESINISTDQRICSTARRTLSTPCFCRVTLRRCSTQSGTSYRRRCRTSNGAERPVHSLR